MNKCFERLYNGIVKENPTLVLMLGMCPTLAVTTSAYNGLGMGLTTTVVLALSNVIIALLRKVIPNKIRIPAFIVIIASFVTIMQLLLQAYIPSLYESLGIYIPLIVVNCIILGRAEAYAYKNPVHLSFFDGLGMGLGFTIALTIIGLIREFIGACTVFGIELGWFTPIGIFKMAPGAFFVLALLTAIQNKVKIEGAKRGKDVSKIQSGCGHDCLNCNVEGCGDRKLETVSELQNDETVEEKNEMKVNTSEPLNLESETAAEEEKQITAKEKPKKKVKKEKKAVVKEKTKEEKAKEEKVKDDDEAKVEVEAKEEKSVEEKKSEIKEEPDAGKETEIVQVQLPELSEEEKKVQDEFDEVFGELTFGDEANKSDDDADGDIIGIDDLNVADKKQEKKKYNNSRKKSRGKKGGK